MTKLLRLRVVEDPTVNVKVPEMKNANLDWDSISAIIEEGEQGKIVEVEDEADHKTVDVWVE